jgi:nucleotide-binding universal stress UspA family protein
MTRSRLVVVGCDGSPDSDEALRFAADEARLRGGHLVVVCAYFRPVDPDLEDFGWPDAKLQAKALARAEVAVRRALGLPPGAGLGDCELLAAEGDPSRVLLAQAGDAALIVIGSHAHRLLGGVFGHHTSRHLLHDVRVPVTVVPCANRSKAAGPLSSRRA